MHLVIVSVPYTLSQTGVKVSKAPAAWQAAGLAERLAPYVTQAVWASLPPLSTAEVTTQEQLVALGRQLSDTVRFYTVHLGEGIPQFALESGFQSGASTHDGAGCRSRPLYPSDTGTGDHGTGGNHFV